VYGQTDKKRDVAEEIDSFFHCGSGKGYFFLGDKKFGLRKS
jgi:hypothetical protein